MGGSRQVISPLPSARRQLVLSLSLLVLSLCVGHALGLEVVGQPPEFTEEPAEALGFRMVVFEVDESGERDNLTLNCDASGDPVPDITWFRDDGVEVDATYVQNGTLFIENITDGIDASRDGVNYYCTATNSFGTIRSRTATVFYAYFDGFTNDPATVEDVTVEVTAGEDVALRCEIMGSEPPAKIVWYMDDSEISRTDTSDNKHYRDNGQYLVITALDEADDITNRLYRCGVTNVRLFEQQMSNTTYVLSNNPSLPLTVYKRLEDKTAVVGESAEFTLVIAEAPIYFYPSCEVSGGSLGIVQISGTALFDVTMVSRPNNYPQDTTFELVCSIDETAILTVQEAVNIVNAPSDDFSRFTGDTVSFPCDDISGVPEPEVDWYFNGVLLSEGGRITIDGNILTVTDTNEDDTGMYQCFVSNSINTKQESWALMVRDPVPPEVSEISAPDDCRESVGRVIAKPDGEDALLRLEIIADPCPDVTWMVDGTEINFENNTLQIPNDPCSSGDLGIFNFTLNITDVTEGFGNYTAYFENRAGDVTTEVVLVTPEVDAKVVEINFSSDPQCLLEGSVARIRCETTGYPEPTITFFFGASGVDFDDERVMLAACDEIVINGVEQDDGGIYSCSATNPANTGGPATPPNDPLLQYCTEPVISSLTASDPQPTEGDDVFLDCRVGGTPPPDVMWQVMRGTSDPVDVVFSNRILQTTVDDDGLVHRLQINEIETEDAGVYLCIATNTAGEDDQSQSIEVREADDEVLSTEAIIGIAAGGASLILLVILLLVCVYMCASKWRKGVGATAGGVEVVIPIAGFVCHCYSSRKKSDSTSQSPEAEYEEIPGELKPPGAIELKENTAYGPVTPHGIEMGGNIAYGQVH